MDGCSCVPSIAALYTRLSRRREFDYDHASGAATWRKYSALSLKRRVVESGNGVESTVNNGRGDRNQSVSVERSNVGLRAFEASIGF
jgi:hypothetical protein